MASEVRFLQQLLTFDASTETMNLSTAYRFFGVPQPVPRLKFTFSAILIINQSQLV